MGSARRTLEQVLRGQSDANIAFADLRQLLLALGFDERTRGSHHVYRRAGVRRLLNLQAERGKAKPYQVRQVRQVLLDNKLAGELDG